MEEKLDVLVRRFLVMNKIYKEMWVCFEIIVKVYVIKLYKVKSCFI